MVTEDPKQAVARGREMQRSTPRFFEPIPLNPARSRVWTDCTEEARTAALRNDLCPLRWCAQCGTTRTGTLRLGPEGEQTLCNRFRKANSLRSNNGRCGLRFNLVEKQSQQPGWCRKRVEIASLIDVSFDESKSVKPRSAKKPRVPENVEIVKTRWKVVPVFKPYQPPPVKSSSND